LIRVAWYSALVLATLTVLVLLWQFSIAVVMFLLSLAVAAAFRPIVESLVQRGLRENIALTISFGSVFSVLIALILVTSEPLLADLQQVIDDLFMAYGWVKNLWLQDQTPLLTNFVVELPPTRELYDALIGTDSSLAVQAVFGAAESTFGFLGRLAIVVALSLYWSAGHVRFERLWLSLLPVENRAQARKIWQDIEYGVGAYLRREITLSVLSGVCLWLGYLILDVKYPVLLAVTGAFARIIPWLGPFSGVIFPILVGSGLGGWASLAAAGFTLLVFILLEMTLGRRIFPHQRYGSLLLVIVVFALVDSFGLPGAVLAPMLAVALQILLNNLIQIHAAETNGLPTRSLADLREKMETIKQMSADLGQACSSETANLAARLENLIEKGLTIER
jgi:putative permease